MKLDRFTEKAQEALQGAAELARESGQQARAGASVQALEPALVLAAG
jgi:hypothetical protein